MSNIETKLLWYMIEFEATVNPPWKTTDSVLLYLNTRPPL